MWHEDFWVPRLSWLPIEEKSIWHLTSLNFSSCMPSGQPTRVSQVDLGLRNSSRLKIQIWKNSVPKKRSFLGQLSTMGSWVLGKFNGAIWMVVIPIFLMRFFQKIFWSGWPEKHGEKMPCSRSLQRRASSIQRVRSFGSSNVIDVHPDESLNKFGRKFRSLMVVTPYIFLFTFQGDTCWSST